MDVKVSFHAQDQFLDLSGRLGYKVRLGKRYESQITIQDVLQIEYKNVDNGIVFYESDRKCSHEPYDKCMYSTLTSAMQRETEDHCTVPWVPGSNKICTKSHDINRTFWISWNRITNRKRDCLKQCRTTLINVGSKNELETEDQEHGQLLAYFSSNVVQSREHYFITLIKLAGQIGGYVGLFKLSIFLLDLIKFNTLINGVFEKSKNDKTVINEKNDKMIVKKDKKVVDQGVKCNESPRSDHLIELSALAINNNSVRVN